VPLMPQTTPPMTRALDLGCGPQPRNKFNATELYGVDVREDLDKNIKSCDLALEDVIAHPGFRQRFRYMIDTGIAA
jgi:hypothetical protein